MPQNTYETLNAQQTGSETDPFTEDRYHQFYSYLRKDARRILDIGCNTGRGGRVLKQKSPDLAISGLDCVQSRLEQLPKAVYSQTIYGFSTEVPVEDNAFDAVVAGEFIEHLYPIDVDKTLSEIFRVLKVGGQLMLTTPNPDDLKKKVRHESVLGGAHVSQHFPHALKYKLKMMGYSNIRLRGSGKVSRYLGGSFPFLNIYGSYLVIADKL